MELHLVRASRRLLVAAAAAAMLGAALGLPVARAADTSVEIASFAYAPAAVTINVGDTVTWTNRDAIEHTVTSAPGAPTAFDSGLICQSQTFSMTFTQPGSYGYFCTPHPTMVGTVTVLPAPQPSSAAASAASAAPSAPTGVSDTAVTGTDATPLAELLWIIGLAFVAFVVLRLRVRRGV